MFNEKEKCDLERTIKERKEVNLERRLFEDYSNGNINIDELQEIRKSYRKILSDYNEEIKDA